MALPLQFAYRTGKSVGVVDADPVYKSAYNTAGENRCIQYSPCGRWLAWASSTEVKVLDTSTSQPIMTLALRYVNELEFSPRGTYLSTYERPAKDEAGDATKNFKIWKVALTQDTVPEPMGQFVQKQQEGWNLHYTADEKYCARLVTNEVQFYESHDLKTVWNKLRVEGIRGFSLGPQNNVVAAYVPQLKGQPASVKIFSIPQFAAPVAQKTFFKGDKVKMFWNHQGTNLLVRVQTEVDKSNQNYYGETFVYLLSANGTFDARVTVDKEGPIHDVAWSPNGKEFGLIYGAMPSKAGIFNHRGVSTHTFPMCPRNTINFSPTGRFVMIAGFGNLAGDVDIYDLEKDFKLVSNFQSSNQTVCEWSNDSCYIFMATLSPRLRVENGVKIWHMTGKLVYKEDMEELYSAMLRPSLRENLPTVDALTSVPTVHESASSYVPKTPSKAAPYRPPGARGQATPLQYKREDQGGAAHVMGNSATSSSMGINGFGRARRTVPGAEPVEPSGPRGVPGAEPANGEENLSKAALKNRKKRGNKKAKEGEAKDGANGEASGGGASLAPPPLDHGAGSNNDRRSPERRGGNHRHHRSLSRNPGNRSRSNTQRGAPRFHQDQGGAPLNPPQGHNNAQNAQQQQQPGGGASAAAADPNAKKIRSLQKKVRAIEELEMRQANGEKLEDTQIQKMATKNDVIKQLQALGA